MTRSLFKQTLLSGTSYGALDIALCFERSGDLSRADVRGLLARVALWLRLMLRGLYGAEIEARSEAQASPREVNRFYSRMARCKIAIARHIDPLALHILKHKGRCAYLRWLYERRLISRIVGCFRRWAWCGLPRVRFAAWARDRRDGAFCNAPLRPD